MTSDDVVEIGEAGQLRVAEFVDRQIRRTHQGMRNRIRRSGGDDIAEMLYPGYNTRIVPEER